jgi:biopolymer transport protein TolR
MQIKSDYFSASFISFAIHATIILYLTDFFYFEKQQRPVLSKPVNVNLPNTDTTKMSVQNEPMVISIDKNGNCYINVGDESLPIDLDELKRKSTIIFEANPDIEIVFQSDKDVFFDSVAKAMAAVQSVGISNIGIVTTGYAD